MNRKDQIDFLSDGPKLSFRHFQGVADFPKMVHIYNSCQQVDGFEKLQTVEGTANQYAHLVNCDPYKDVIFAEIDGEAVGYGRCWWLQEIKGDRLYLHYAYLLPTWRGAGIRRAMLQHNEKRFTEIAATHPPTGKRWLQSWASETETHWQALLQNSGYQIARYNLDMVQSNLNNVPDIQIPMGICIRRGTQTDWRQIWEAAREAFRDHWGEVAWQEEDYLMESNSPTFNPDLWQIAWDGNEVAGGILNFVDAEENRSHGRLRGYTEYVFVRKPWRKRGLARILLARSLNLFYQAGMSEAALTVDAENTSEAVKLYADMGFQTVKKSAVYRKLLKS